MSAPRRWRLLNSGYQTGAFNMALDQAILESVAAGMVPPTFRLYRWQPATVTLGYGQNAEHSVNLEACREFNYDVVRRCTGGRAVLHDHEVTYALIASESGGDFGCSTLENYRLIAEALQEAFSYFGFFPTLQSGRDRGRAGELSGQSVCFAVPAQYELVLNGCKMVGSAQRRWQGTFLQHGSIPLELDLAKLSRVLRPGAAADSVTINDRLAQRVGWINRWLAEPTTVDRVETVLQQAIATKFNVQWHVDEPSPDELRRATELQASHYSELNWKGKPALFAQ